MTDEQKALSRRAVACKGWRWVPGMAAQAVLADGAVEPVVGIVVGFMDVLPSVWWPDLLARRVHHPTEHLIPDLTDPATLGCLLALVREAWRCPTVYVRQSTTRRASDSVIAWEVCDLYLDAEACRALGVPREGSVGSWGHFSEAEALVFALESAP
jgi:hypothetical protein